jgi:UDP-N-acetylmuramoyl-tripeptide--D-alanyl-D-alanine ligase
VTGFYIVASLATIAALTSRAYRSLHMYQLEGYRAERYLRHSMENIAGGIRAHAAAFLAVVLVAELAILTDAPQVVIASVVLAAWVVQSAVLTCRIWTRPAKIPLALTARLRRIAVATGLLTAAAVAVAVAALVAAGLGTTSPAVGAWTSYAVAGLLVLAEPLLVVAGSLVLEPYEASMRRRFVAEARGRLEHVRPLVIGVAGSYGKTTTKSALAAVLSRKFKVLASPESYNTLLGVTRTINEGLTDDIEVLIVEMGARHEGDIRELCELVRPTIGVITRLGPQHLEYFKDEATVVRAKTELLAALPADGFAVVDADGISGFSHPEEWAARVIRLSTRPEAEPDALLRGVSIGGDGTSFEIAWRERAPFEARTPLMGRHAAVNCALAAAVGLELDIEPVEVRAGLGSMAPVPHRLEMIRNDSVVVIDDAFNSNPEGFAAALEVLASFEGRRILVTPGMIELGSETVPAHQRIGRLAASACDIVILVGASWPKEFAESMLDAGLPPAQLERFGSLAEATVRLGKLIRSGDVVLFENDLPDNFA